MTVMPHRDGHTAAVNVTPRGESAEIFGPTPDPHPKPTTHSDKPTVSGQPRPSP